MYTPPRSSSNSLFGLFGGDFGLNKNTDVKNILKKKINMCLFMYIIQLQITNLPFLDDSLDKTLDDELLSL